jgi:hypothetical protein
MSFDLFADGDSVDFEIELRDERGDLVDADTATVSVRKARSVQNKDWAGATVMLADAPFENLALGSYRYSWSTTGCVAGKYVAQATVVRGGVTNIERLLVNLK